MKEWLSVGRVFVPGGLPTVTYNPRLELGLERSVTDFLNERHRMLSVSGPTKSGKTVLLKRLLPDAMWLSGGSLDTANDFWNAINDELGLYTTESASEGQQETASRTTSGGGGLGSIARVDRSGTDQFSTDRGSTRGRERSASAVAREALRQSQPVLVIDDFHYIEPAVQLQIIRGLKDLVFEGVAVIVAAVPHRAYDAVRVEKEMTGRVEQLAISFWSKEELRGIASVGFAALNVVDDSNLDARLADEAFSSPHLMQDFCLQLCKANDVQQTQEHPLSLGSPRWPEFFADRASLTSKAAFDLLARGPRQRKDRKERVLKGGTVTDIYGLVLRAIARTGPLTELTYEQLRAAVREIVQDDPPQRHEITRVLEEMSKIAKEQIEGEPVVDYDVELGTLFISDPFFAYFLRWGAAPGTRGASDS